MPSETFLRLPEEKRKRFIEAAWSEFTRVKFADASINQIVRQAGIPRGSFYQYFAGKEEVFAYILEDVKTYVVRLFVELLQETGGDIFQLQMTLYDHVTKRHAPRPLMDRCFRVLEINPGIDLQKLLGTMMQSDFPGELLERIRISSLRQQDAAYVRRVFLMTLGTLGRAVMDALLQPERDAEFRAELAAQLRIIAYGCLASESGGGAEDSTSRRDP